MHDLFAALRRANRLDRVHLRRRRRRRNGSGGAGARRTLTAFTTGGGSGADVAEQAPRSGRPSLAVCSVSSGLRSDSMIWPSDCASAMRSASSGETSSVTTAAARRPLRGVLGVFGSLLVVTRPRREHLDVAHHRPRRALILLADRDHQIDSRPGIEESGDADDIVHLDRHRAHALRNGGRKSGAAFGAARACSRPSARFPRPTTGARGSPRLRRSRSRQAPCCLPATAQPSRSAAVSRTPVGSARAATTTNVRATSTSRTGMRLRVRYTPKLASAAVSTATPTTTT